MKPKKAAGYIRVSTYGQKENESLPIQTESIKKVAKAHGYKFTKMYADEGISGGTVKDRPGLQLCLEDGQEGAFDVLIVLSLSRFGRNAQELLQNLSLLKESGITLFSINEGIDFSTTYGKAMYGMFSVMAELEKDMIAERMLGGKIHKAHKGIPTSGSLPIGRTFDEKTMEWSLDETVTEALQWAANEYLKGRGLKEVAEEMKTKYNLSMIYDNLRRTLKEKCGDKWTENFKGDIFTYKIPRILPNDTIKQIHERLLFNASTNRTDIKKKYLLSGFIFCRKCRRALVGQTQGKYVYYRHSNRIDDKICMPRPFNQIDAKRIEKAVFRTIFENIVDVPSFEAAIAESLPDEKAKEKLKIEIGNDRKALRTITEEKNKLIELALNGTLKRETIQKKEEGLIKQRDMLRDTLDGKERRLDNMPDIDSIKEVAHKIRKLLLEKYSGEQRYDNMTFEEKRELLHWLFDGIYSTGDRYGIYINKKGQGKEAMIDYFFFGQISGLRTLKGDNIIDFYELQDESGKILGHRDLQMIKGAPGLKKRPSPSLFHKTKRTGGKGL